MSFGLGDLGPWPESRDGRSSAAEDWEVKKWITVGEWVRNGPLDGLGERGLRPWSSGCRWDVTIWPIVVVLPHRTTGIGRDVAA